METKQDNKKDSKSKLKKLGAIRVSLGAVFGAAGGVIALVLIVVLIVAAVNNNGNLRQPVSDPDAQQAAIRLAVDSVQNKVADEKYEEIYNTFLRAGLEDIRKNLQQGTGMAGEVRRDVLNEIDAAASSSDSKAVPTESSSTAPVPAPLMAESGGNEIGAGNSGSAGASDGGSTADSAVSRAGEMVAPQAAGQDGTSASKAPVFSGTNIQEEGVQEADVIKTDGKHIFTINNKHLTILDAGAGKPKVVSQIQQIAEAGQHYFEMYIVGDRLIAIRNTEAPEKKSVKEKVTPDPPANPEPVSGPAVDPAADPAPKPDPAVDLAPKPDPVTKPNPAVDPAVDPATKPDPAVDPAPKPDPAPKSVPAVDPAQNPNAPSATAPAPKANRAPAPDPEPSPAPDSAGSSAAATEDMVQAIDDAGNLVDVGKIMPWNPVARDASVDIFDIRDLSNPKKVGSLSQSGSYANSRMIGGILYLVSNYSEFDYVAIEKDAPETYVPRLTENGNSRVMPAGDITIPPGSEGMNYTVISGIDTAGKGSFLSQKSVFGRNFEVYCAPENLYLTTGDEIHKKEDTATWTDEIWSGATIVTRISLNKGKVDVRATAKVPGNILNQFSLDEQDGVLRLVTNCYVSSQRTPKRKTTEKDGKIYDEYGKELKERPVTDGDIEYHDSQTTALYTLDKDLKVLGSITNLAPDENVYSCRFLGDYGYFVTFRQVDPLFTVELQDPKKPKIVGKLKIPGFSEYLHPYAKGLLFGFGRDADEESGEVGNLKLSMFDNSDPTKVKEQDTLVLKGLYSSEVSGNHKAILVDARRSLIAFPADNSYLIYTWTEKDGFQKQAEVVISDDSDWYKALRGLFIDHVFYVLSPKAITTFDMDGDFKRISSLTYDKDASGVGAGDAVPMARSLIME